MDTEYISAAQTELGIKVLQELKAVEKQLQTIQVTNPDDEYKLSVATKQIALFIQNMDVNQPNADRFSVATGSASVLAPNASVATMPAHIKLLTNVRDIVSSINVKQEKTKNTLMKSQDGL